jgi:MFS superfamily sulfate permease-like transporter
MGNIMEAIAGHAVLGFMLSLGALLIIVGLWIALVSQNPFDDGHDK